MLINPRTITRYEVQETHNPGRFMVRDMACLAVLSVHNGKVEADGTARAMNEMRLRRLDSGHNDIGDFLFLGTLTEAECEVYNGINSVLTKLGVSVYGDHPEDLDKVAAYVEAIVQQFDDDLALKILKKAKKLVKKNKS